MGINQLVGKGMLGTFSPDRLYIIAYKYPDCIETKYSTWAGEDSIEAKERFKERHTLAEIIAVALIIEYNDVSE
mgnify:FL=1